MYMNARYRLAHARLAAGASDLVRTIASYALQISKIDRMVSRLRMWPADEASSVRK